MVYANSCEEHRYLAAIRKEKESFERLVKERGVSKSAWQRLKYELTGALVYAIDT
jgi:hypothetical protein